MIKTFCDCCNIDLTTEEEAWAFQYGEIKHGGNSLVMHFCVECAKAVLNSVERVIKKRALADGEA